MSVLCTNKIVKILLKRNSKLKQALGIFTTLFNCCVTDKDTFADTNIAHNLYWYQAGSGFSVSRNLHTCFRIGKTQNTLCCYRHIIDMS